MTETSVTGPTNQEWDEADYDGECFICGSEGEIEERKTAQLVPIPAELAETLKPDPDHKRDQMMLFYCMQYSFLVFNLPSIPIDVVAKISALRTLVYKEGLYNWHVKCAEKFCKYDDFIVNTKHVETRPMNECPLDHAWMKKIRPLFTDMLCCVAYMFRTRAHHFVGDMSARYTSLWNRCLHQDVPLGLDWNYIACHVCHAIYPIDLDKIWQDAISNSRCAGTLIKRWDCAPAGTAGIRAVRRGLDDVNTVCPNLFPDHHRAVRHLVQIENELSSNRWAGSVNSRLYGAQRVVYNEGILGVLAAAILQLLDKFASGSMLRNSNALHRIAENAPIAGGVLGSMLGIILTDTDTVRRIAPTMLSGLLPGPE